MYYALAFILSYAFGGIPFGFILGKIKGLDIRQHGSGNIGFTNVLRVCGVRLGLLAFFLDVFKGFLPVFIFYHYLGLPYGILAGAGALLGHIFTPYLGFLGGKGVATGLGIFIALSPLVAAIAFGVWFVLLIAIRYVSFASMSAGVALPIVVYLKYGKSNIFLFSVVAAILVIVRHKDNIVRLVQRKENSFSFKKI
jgi:glycerol-3-phosphate acyltransferase PlsY